MSDLFHLTMGSQNASILLLMIQIFALFGQSKDHILFIHSSVDGHAGCFQDLDMGCYGHGVGARPDGR